MAKGKAPCRGMEEGRKKAREAAADAVASALEHDRRVHGRRYTDYRDFSRRMGRDMSRTLTQILKEGDTTVTTLSDIAHVTGCQLVIRMVPASPASP